jgi:hypothetical protein
MVSTPVQTSLAQTRHTQTSLAQTRLTQTQWRPRASAHRARVEPWVAPRLQRRRRGEKHPVDDFLFEYYTFRPAQLSRWQPGPGVALQSPVEDLAGVSGFAERDGWVAVDAAAVARQAALLPQVDGLLRATAERRPRIGCSALHEWAMVYQLPQQQVRHAQWPLRLSGRAIAEVVEEVGLRCTHFDAFRFFTEAAAGRNEAQLTRQLQIATEQPGCLHATMDLYKWAYRLSPLVSADLIADTFELARAARELDMRAAPYDLQDLGLEPLPLETPAGRSQFAALQRELAAAGQDLRARLIAAVEAAGTWLAAQRGS